MTTKKHTTPKPRTRKTYIVRDLPAEGFIRLPTVAAALGISHNSVTNWVKDGRIPPGFLLSPRTRVWDVADIRELLDRIKHNAPK